MIDIKPLDDVMFHFKYAFIAYIILFIIVVFNLLKAIYIKKKCHEEKLIFKIILGIDLVIDILCGIAMAGGVMFQGVLADNNAVDCFRWMKILDVISIISFIIFILNVIVVFRRKK